MLMVMLTGVGWGGAGWGNGDAHGDAHGDANGNGMGWGGLGWGTKINRQSEATHFFCFGLGTRNLDCAHRHTRQCTQAKIVDRSDAQARVHTTHIRAAPTYIYMYI